MIILRNVVACRDVNYLFTVFFGAGKRVRCRHTLLSLLVVLALSVQTLPASEAQEFTEQEKRIIETLREIETDSVDRTPTTSADEFTGQSRCTMKHQTFFSGGEYGVFSFHAVGNQGQMVPHVLMEFGLRTTDTISPTNPLRVLVDAKRFEGTLVKSERRENVEGAHYAIDADVVLKMVDAGDVRFRVEGKERNVEIARLGESFARNVSAFSEHCLEEQSWVID